MGGTQLKLGLTGTAGSPPSILSHPLFTSLSDTQCKAALSTSPRLVLLAGAGAGKTRVLVARLAFQLWGPEPLGAASILAITFTRKACREIRERLEAVSKSLGVQGALPAIDTFHATALKILRTGGMGGLKILSEGLETQMCLEAFLRQDAALQRRGLTPEQLQGALDGSLPGILRADATPLIAKRYRRFKVASGSIALDDLVPLALEALEQPRVRASWAGRLRSLMVDEFQDVDDGQMALFEALTGPRTGFSLFGDDDQAIYRWRGSNPENLRACARREDVDVCVLPTNYRSRPPILDLAGAVIAKAQGRLDKPVVAHQKGGVKPRCILGEDIPSQVAKEVRRQGRGGRDFAAMAILVRDHRDGRAIGRALTKEGVAFVESGTSPRPGACRIQTYHSAKGLEFTSVLLPFMEEGRFPGTRRVEQEKVALKMELASLEDAYRRYGGLRRSRRRILQQTLWALRAAYLSDQRLPRGRTSFERFVIGSFAWVGGLWKRFWARDLTRSLRAREKELGDVQGPLLELAAQAARYDALSDALEAFPKESQETLTEERRLFYVAITRAKEELVLFAPSRRGLSPFLRGLPRGLIDFESPGA